MSFVTAFKKRQLKIKGANTIMTEFNAVKATQTQQAPKGLGLSSQTVAFSHYNNLSAQLPINPESGELVAGGVREQAHQCFKNIKAIVESVGHVMTDIVKITIYVRGIKDLDAVDAVYKSFFPTGTPARTVVGVSNLLNNACVQIDAVVANAEGTPPTVSF